MVIAAMIKRMITQPMDLDLAAALMAPPIVAHPLPLRKSPE
jgi:hypothetical protein